MDDENYARDHVGHGHKGKHNSSHADHRSTAPARVPKGAIYTSFGLLSSPLFAAAAMALVQCRGIAHANGNGCSS
jgi:hypothetical protein